MWFLSCVLVESLCQQFSMVSTPFPEMSHEGCPSVMHCSCGLLILKFFSGVGLLTHHTTVLYNATSSKAFLAYFGKWWDHIQVFVSKILDHRTHRSKPVGQNGLGKLPAFKSEALRLRAVFLSSLRILSLKMKQSHIWAAKSHLGFFFFFLGTYNDTSIFKHIFLFLNQPRFWHMKRCWMSGKLE